MLVGRLIISFFFVKFIDLLGQLGISGLNQATAALRMLAYGNAADALDENLEISKSTALKSLMKFVDTVIKCFEETYFRNLPNLSDKHND